MKIVIFGLTISSSWGNAHASLWRGLCRCLSEKRHRVVFFEHDVPYYAGARDLYEMPGNDKLILYENWYDIAPRAAREVSDADVAIVTSYCPDAIAATDLMPGSRALRVFYDLDTPVTLSQHTRGEVNFYIGPRGLADFDLVLSYTGGGALDALRNDLGARVVAPLYGHVDPEHHRPSEPRDAYRADLSFLGSYVEDRQASLEELFIETARRRPNLKFLIGGALYPDAFRGRRNINFARHLPPGEHPAFFASCRASLNVTRADMARMGWCPSEQLFEAAACEAPVLTDSWSGLESFFKPGSEVLVVRNADDVLAALDRSDAELKTIARAARERVLVEHTSRRRTDQLLALLSGAMDRARGNRPQMTPGG